MPTEGITLRHTDDWVNLTLNSKEGFITFLNGSFVSLIQADSTSTNTELNAMAIMGELPKPREKNTNNNLIYTLWGVPEGESIFGKVKPKLRSPEYPADKPNYSKLDDLIGVAGLSVTREIETNWIPNYAGVATARITFPEWKPATGSEVKVSFRVSINSTATSEQVLLWGGLAGETSNQVSWFDGEVRFIEDGVTIATYPCPVDEVVLISHIWTTNNFVGYRVIGNREDVGGYGSGLDGSIVDVRLIDAAYESRAYLCVRPEDPVSEQTIFNLLPEPTLPVKQWTPDYQGTVLESYAEVPWFTPLGDIFTITFTLITSDDITPSQGLCTWYSPTYSTFSNGLFISDFLGTPAFYSQIENFGGALTDTDLLPNTEYQVQIDISFTLGVNYVITVNGEVYNLERSPAVVTDNLHFGSGTNTGGFLRQLKGTIKDIIISDPLDPSNTRSYPSVIESAGQPTTTVLTDENGIADGSLVDFPVGSEWKEIGEATLLVDTDGLMEGFGSPVWIEVAI